MLLWILLSFLHADTNCASHYEVTAGKVEFFNGTKHENVVRVSSDSFAEIAPVRECSENVYGRDKFFVYLNGKIVEAAEPAKFFVESLDDRYAHDQVHAYWKGRQIAQATGKGFRAVATNYARDINRGFYQELAIPEVDPMHLIPAGGGFVRDGARAYYKTDAFPLSQFHVFGAYVRLGDKVFYHQAVLPGAAAESFEALGDCFGRDLKSAWLRASRWPAVKGRALAALAADSPLREACTNADGENCCARLDKNLLAVVRESKTGTLRTLNLPLSEVQALTGEVLKAKTWTFKKLVEQP